MSTAERQPDTELRRGSIGTRHLVFFVLSAAAPLTVMAGFAPIAYLVAGQIAPVGYLIAGVVYALFAVGFTAMSRHVQNAGAFYAYITQGLGRIPGGGAALLAYAGYTLGQIGFAAAAGLFASTALQTFLHVTVPWGVSAVVIGLIVAALSYRQVKVGARVLAVLLTAEIAVLFVLAIAILVRGAPEGYSGAAFNPENWTVSALGGLFVFCFVVYIGFEQTAVYSEEVKDPRRTVPRATYLAVGILALVYTFIAWIILMGIGPGNLQKVLSGDLSAVVFDVNTRYAGNLMTDVMQVLVVTSFLAGVLALHNAGSRYLYSMARENMLPTTLTRTGRTTGSPQAACLVQTVIVLGSLVGFGLTSLDPYTQVVIWTNTPTLVAVLVLQIATSLAVIRYFARRSATASLWHRLIAPVLATLALAGVLCLVLTKLSLLTELGPLGNFAIMVPLIVATLGGLARAVFLHRRSAPSDQQTQNRVETVTTSREEPSL